MEQMPTPAVLLFPAISLCCWRHKPLAYPGNVSLGEALFGLRFGLMVLSVAVSARAIQVALDALNVHWRDRDSLRQWLPGAIS